MDNIQFISLIWLLPIVFMIHDFEEIIFINWWMKKNEELISKNYPRIFNEYNGMSTAAFALAVSEEFILLVGVTLASVVFNWYYLWLGALIGFLVHLLVHVFQWIVFKKYTPMIFTSFIGIAYSIYALDFVYNTINPNIVLLVIWGFTGVVIVWFNILFVHKLARRFDEFIKKSLSK